MVAMTTASGTVGYLNGMKVLVAGTGVAEVHSYTNEFPLESKLKGPNWVMFRTVVGELTEEEADKLKAQLKSLESTVPDFTLRLKYSYNNLIIEGVFKKQYTTECIKIMEAVAEQAKL